VALLKTKNQFTNLLYLSSTYGLPFSSSKLVIPRAAVTLNLLMTHAACLMAHVQIGLEVEISIPSFFTKSMHK